MRAAAADRPAERLGDRADRVLAVRGEASPVARKFPRREMRPGVKTFSPGSTVAGLNDWNDATPDQLAP